MVKLRRRNIYTNYIKLLQYVAVSAIVLFMTAQPQVELVFYVSDIKHEIGDAYDEEESKESESEEKEQQEQKQKHHKYCTSDHLEGKHLVSNFSGLSQIDIHQNRLTYIMEYYMAVSSPPPEFT